MAETWNSGWIDWFMTIPPKAGRESKTRGKCNPNPPARYHIRSSPWLEPFRISVFFSSECKSVTPSSDSMPNELRRLGSSSCCESEETRLGAEPAGIVFRSGIPLKMTAAMSVKKSKKLSWDGFWDGRVKVGFLV